MGTGALLSLSKSLHLPLCLELSLASDRTHIYVYRYMYTWGRHGFDVGVETLSACRGTEYLVKPAVNLIVANDDNYALAA